MAHLEPGRHPKIVAVTYQNPVEPGEETLTHTEYGESVVWVDRFRAFGVALGLDVIALPDSDEKGKIKAINDLWPDMAIMFRANDVAETEVVYRSNNPLVVTRATILKDAVVAAIGSVDGGILRQDNNKFLKDTNCDAYIVRVDTLTNMTTYEEAIETAGYEMALQLRSVIAEP